MQRLRENIRDRKGNERKSVSKVPVLQELENFEEIRGFQARAIEIRIS